jgi:hypothetical protein
MGAQGHLTIRQHLETKRIPQENPKLEVPRVFHKAKIKWFSNYIESARAKCVFQVEEMRISEREDRIETRIIIPSAT